MFYTKILCFEEIQFENQCNYVDATIREFIEWKSFKKQGHSNNKKPKLDGPFENFNLDDNWAYADYKYMADFFQESKIISMDPFV